MEENMEENLFGIKWEMKVSEGRKYGAIYSYTHDDFGTIHLSLEAQDLATEEECSIPFYKILAVLREFYLQNKCILICTDIEKKRLEGIYGGKCIHLTFEQITSMFPSNISEKENRILKNLSIISPGLGKKIKYDYQSYDFMPCDFFVENNEEVEFMLRVLKKHDFIAFEHISDGKGPKIGNIEITADGWLQIEKSSKNLNSNQAFIAMWFDSKMDECLSIIKECCLKNKYKPLCIKNKEHNNEISGEILKEIKNSKFLIADVTEQRQGVYFEAGYAMALGLPVIWTCREDDMENVHFDTRQYNHVVWKDITELNEKLNSRIKGTID